MRHNNQMQSPNFMEIEPDPNDHEPIEIPESLKHLTQACIYFYGAEFTPADNIDLALAS